MNKEEDGSDKGEKKKTAKRENKKKRERKKETRPRRRAGSRLSQPSFVKEVFDKWEQGLRDADEFGREIWTKKEPRRNCSSTKDQYYSAVSYRKRVDFYLFFSFLYESNLLPSPRAYRQHTNRIVPPFHATIKLQAQ